ncbi:MAG: argininosuccinate lyase [Kiritimatiellae bacterium]|nr:argininosuccinate lyase [Kiritimatiellia bacterium]
MKEQAKDKKTLIGKINPDVLRFTVGDDPVLDRKLTVWDCLGSAAHAATLAALKVKPAVITKAERDAVIAELVQIIRDAEAGSFEITEADQDVHLAIERRLTERLGDLGRKIHTGRSRNDQVAVDIRLHLKDGLLGLTGEVAALAEALVKFARRHVAVPMVGRTHLQPAMPSTVGMWASGYAEMLLDDLPAVEAAYVVNDLCPLGSAAGYGVPLPLDRILTARLLGFARPLHNVFYASCARGKDEAAALSACAQIMVSLSRLAQDLILFSMPEFGYFTLPREMCTGSSIMPQKYNPDVLELIRAKAARVQSCANAVAGILTAMPGGYNRDLQDTKGLYMEGLETTRASLRILALLVASVTVNRDRLRAGFIPGVFATDRALELVAGGMPFRDAYQQIRSHLEDLTAADPDAAVAAKTSWGDTNGLDFDFYRDKIHAVRSWVAERRNHAYRAFSKLLGTKFPLA